DGVLVCHKCQDALDPTAEGEWVAAHPGASVIGYHVNKLYSPRADLPGLAGLGYAIEDGLVADTSTIQEFKNQDLGLAYAPEGGSLNDSVIDACERAYEHPGPIVGFPVAMGIDVGAVLHVTVKCREKDDDPEATRLLYAGTTQDWGDLDRLMQTWKVNRAVIDGMPEDGKSMAFARRWPGRAFVAFYPDMTRWSHVESAVWKANDPVVLIHRTRAFDDLFARFIQQKEHLPQGSGFIRGFREQLKAPIRVVSTDANGRLVARYDEGSAADHYAHASVYCQTAWQAMRGSGGGQATPYSVVSGAGVVKANLAAPVQRRDETPEQFEGRQAVYAAERALLAGRRKFDELASRNRRNVFSTRAGR
ncbi:MAG: phage terminase large subunit family protein, partial [Dehalococcoidia bacterium]|nr:phage terminase large subunit family protein [Dehalococcoidia bacterium]